MADLPIPIESYRNTDELDISAQRCVNAYAELHQGRGRSPVSVSGAPGIVNFTTAGNGPIRGFYYMQGQLYCVSGNTFHSIDADGTVTDLGSGITNENVVDMAGNDLQIIIVNNTTTGWVYTVSGSSFAQIADADFNACASVAFIDSYFVHDWKDTNKFFHSDLLDGTSYPALGFASAESSDDRVLSVLNNEGNLIIFGEKTFEVWNHTGATNFVFQRYDGRIPQRGIAAPLAKCIADQSAFFLGNDRVFYRLNGFNPIRVSTHALEHIWGKYATVSDAFCFVVEFSGHKFVYLTFPTQGTTWAYDVATQRWHERVSWDPGGNEVRWRANCAIQAYNKTFIGDANSNKIGYLDADTFTEFGDPIVMELAWAPIHMNGRRGFMPKFAVNMQTGVGITTGQGSDPQIMMDYSDDGGRTWSPELWKTLGAKGNYRTRVEWDRLGSFYNRVMRVRVSDPVRRTMFSARAPGLHFEGDY